MAVGGVGGRREKQRQGRGWESNDGQTRQSMENRRDGEKAKKGTKYRQKKATVKGKSVDNRINVSQKRDKMGENSG